MKKEEKKAQLSRDLLKVLRTDEAYRQFSAAQDFHKQAGQEIGSLRKKKKLSAKELAEKIGKKESDISKMERGEYKQYTLKLLLKIADATGSGLKIEYE
jgi:ribosome-binding protein aMBF1 (putative translation factor)